MILSRRIRTRFEQDVSCALVGYRSKSFEERTRQSDGQSMQSYAAADHEGLNFIGSGWALGGQTKK